MVIGDISAIELPCDFDVGLSLYDELLEYPSDNGNLFVRPQPKPHTVRFQGLYSPFASRPLSRFSSSTISLPSPNVSEPPTR